MTGWFNRVSPLVLLLLILAPWPALSDTESDATVRIELTGLDQADGNIYIAVYDSEDTWLGDAPILQRKVVIAEALAGEVLLTELNLQPGEYAFSIFYDSNNNGKLDTNFIGIPKEPLALSNNARPKFGPPRYEDAVFQVGEELIVQRLSIEAI